MTFQQPEAALPVSHVAQAAHGRRKEFRRNSPLPSGTVYTTKPGGSLFFPQLAIPTGQLVIPQASGPPRPNRGLMMPMRTRTRAYRIALERQHNAARIARKHLLLAERITRDHEPPPF